MDDAFEVGVADGLADLQEKFETLGDGELFAVAVVRDGFPADEFHHEKRTSPAGDSGIEHAGDVRMIHQRERLPLGLEARDHRARVHAELDDLDRDFAAHGLRLRGPIDHAAAALADFFENPVARKIILVRPVAAGSSSADPSRFNPRPSRQRRHCPPGTSAASGAPHWEHLGRSGISFPCDGF